MPGKKVGDPFVDPVKYAWFNNPMFRRAVSMAIDRDAIIQSVFFGDGVKNWSLTTPRNKVWYIPDLVHYDYNPAEAKRLLASLGLEGPQRRRRARGRARAIRSRFTLKTNADNKMRVGDGELRQGRSGEGRHQGRC